MLFYSTYPCLECIFLLNTSAGQRLYIPEPRKGGNNSVLVASNKFWFEQYFIWNDWL